MLVELTLHKGLHIGMLGGEKRYREMEIALDYFDIYGCSKKRMQFPAMGCLFATTFNCVLCVLSPKQYITYLPLRLGPMDEIKIVQMVLYDDNHFLKFYWKEDDPIPPIRPGWRNHRYPDASVWEHILFDRIYEWGNLIGHPLVEAPSLEDDLLSALKMLTDAS